ncbi:hypothetical protein Poly51_33730 [Rubripirellula tenax]|uniref:Prepilin-type N-terminal cleavage/methylation domain-containing protein n=1 Tax=Rubripirellula tenax TaxID=2528015 RepID=A0A5C6F224_9BACT|nr:prepilin-type N-terminal cleavage/methylation domain-containing protein [Rubripirellula tenax]TWU54654.1 hypothetical protein Poly51_33730 [Rubripirellula tenax]
MKTQKKQLKPRRGVSLIEVIACTAIVAVMVVPVASVIRASARAIGRASNVDAEVQTRSALRWVKETIQTGTVIDVGSRNLTLILASGDKAEIVFDSDRLILSDGRTKTVILENVGSFECESIVQSEKPGLPIGVAIRIGVKDPESGEYYKIESYVSTLVQT